MTPEHFVSEWIRKRHRERFQGPDRVPSTKKLTRLKDEMTERQSAVDFHVAQYVRSTLEYGVELTRSEYRTLANRNWRIIQTFGVRVTRILLVFVIAALVLGLFQLKATNTANNAVNDVQHDRRHSLEEKCKSGKEFDKKLRNHIKTLPEPRREEEVKQLSFTEDLVSTVVPVTAKECNRSLVEAGFKP